LGKQYKYIRETALRSCTALVFAEKVPLIEFYDAAFMCLYLGANGNIIKAVEEKNIKEKGNLSHYESELAKFIKEHKDVSEHFKNATKQIFDNYH
jgi:hypothetical protein